MARAKETAAPTGLGPPTTARKKAAVELKGDSFAGGKVTRLSADEGGATSEPGAKVVFLANWKRYFVGDVATFSIALSARLVSAGVARYADGPQAKPVEELSAEAEAAAGGEAGSLEELGDDLDDAGDSDDDSEHKPKKRRR